MSHEPLHQAPNPLDLRRVPPASAECAMVRGLLRDFADSDLAATAVLLVENHVHACRTCAIELARAEHESMRLQRAFADSAAPQLPAGFAARVVERLVLDETSLVSPTALAAAVVGAVRKRAAERRVAEPQVGPPSTALAGVRRVAPMTVLLLATMLVVALVGSIAVFDGGAGGPERVARLVVVAADGLTDLQGNLLPVPNGLGEQQALRVGHGGEARVNWHDLSTKVQPAASLNLHGAGEVRMLDGRPLLVHGNVEVSTNRPVSIPIADGSRLDLGIGEYSLAAGSLDGQNGLPTREGDAFASAPADLFVRIDVHSGEPAAVVRGNSSTIVKAGQTGLYQGDTVFVPTSGGIEGAPASEPTRVGAPSLPPAPVMASLTGQVLDPNGMAGVGAEVRLSFGGASGVQNISKITALDGSFSVPVANHFDFPFAIALAFAGGGRADLGMVAPNAWQLLSEGSHARLASPITLGYSASLTGNVVDDLGVRRSGVVVVPCIVDDVFGYVLALQQFRTSSDPSGNYRIDRLPSALPPHQTLMVLMVHPGLEPRAVPVPQRGSLLATEWMAPTVLSRLRTVRLHLLGAYNTVTIYEEIEGLPPEAAARHHTVTTDGNGYVNAFSVGRGRLYQRGGPNSAPMLRELVMDEVAPLPRYRLNSQPPRPFGSVFASLQTIPDTSVEITNSYRHQRFALQVDGELADDRVGQVVDSMGRGVRGAQVFAVDATGPRGLAESRFLGFTADDGGFPCGSLGDTSDLLVIGRRGGIGFYRDAGQTSSPRVTLQAGVRVQLDAALHPIADATGNPQAVVTVQFRRLGSPVQGLRFAGVRFFSAANGWEIDDLPPGSYEATIDNVVRQLLVPEFGSCTLRD